MHFRDAVSRTAPKLVTFRPVASLAFAAGMGVLCAQFVVGPSLRDVGVLRVTGVAGAAALVFLTIRYARRRRSATPRRGGRARDRRSGPAARPVSSVGGAPVPLGVHVGGDTIELLWTGPPPVPRAPWRTSAAGWMWLAHAQDLRRDEGCRVLPLLVHLGDSAMGNFHLNLEAFSTLAIGGDVVEAAQVAQQLVDGLDESLVDVAIVDHDGSTDVAGPGSVEPIVVEMRRRHARLRAALHGTRWSSAFEARCHGRRIGGWRPLVAFIEAGIDPEITRRLARAARSSPGSVCIVVGDAPGEAMLECRQGQIVCPFLGDVALISPGAHAQTPAETESTSGDDCLPDAPTLPQPRSDSDDADIALEAAPGVSVGVLGPVEIRGALTPLAGKSVELVAYLACHPEGISHDRVKAAVWPQRRPRPQTWRNRLWECRRALGVSRAGELALPHLEDRVARLATWVRTDLDQLSEALARARTVEAGEAIARLRGAMQLVRGRPFDEPSGYEWAFSELHVAHAERLVTDAALQLCTLALEAGDARLALWGSEQGLRACPGSEQLTQARMRSFGALGDVVGVEAAMRDLLATIGDDDPRDVLHPDTYRLYDQLRHPGAGRLSGTEDDLRG